MFFEIFGKTFDLKKIDQKFRFFLAKIKLTNELKLTEFFLAKEHVELLDQGSHD